METQKITSCDLSLAVTAAISEGTTSRIRRSGRCPHAVFTDPRWAELTSDQRLVLIAVHLFAVRDDAQRVAGVTVRSVGWLLSSTGGAGAIRRLEAWTHLSEAEVLDALTILRVLGAVVLSDEDAWGAVGWETEGAPRLRARRAALAQSKGGV